METPGKATAAGILVTLLVSLLVVASADAATY